MVRKILNTFDMRDCLHTFIAAKCGGKKLLEVEGGMCPNDPQLATPVVKSDVCTWTENVGEPRRLQANIDSVGGSWNDVDVVSGTRQTDTV